MRLASSRDMPPEPLGLLLAIMASGASSWAKKARSSGVSDMALGVLPWPSTAMPGEPMVVPPTVLVRPCSEDRTAPYLRNRLGHADATLVLRTYGHLFSDAGVGLEKRVAARRTATRAKANRPKVVKISKATG